MVASADRVLVTWEGTGTSSPITLGSALSARYTAPPSSLDGETVTYLIEHQDPTIDEVELGRGVYTHSGTLIARTSIVWSTNGGVGGSAVNFSAGVKHIRLSLSATDLQGRFISALPAGTPDGVNDRIMFWDASDSALKQAAPNALPAAAAPTEVAATPTTGVYILSTAVRSNPENVTLVTTADSTDIEAPAGFAASGEIHKFEVLVEHTGCTASIAGDPAGRVINGVTDGDPVPLGEPGSTVYITVRAGNVLKVEGETGEESIALAAIDMDGKALRNAFVESEKLNPLTASTGGAFAPDYELGNQIVVNLTENITSHSISNVPATGKRVTLTYKIVQDTSDRTMVWPTGTDWGAPGAPTLSSGSGARTWVTLISDDGGTTWDGILGKVAA